MNDVDKKIEIIYAGKDFIAVNKPAGIAMHGGKSVRGKTVADFLVAQFPELKKVGDDPAVRPGMVHRLDKDTSGVLLVARTEQAFHDLKNLFKMRQVEKTYAALAVGHVVPRKRIVDLKIGRMVKRPALRATEQSNIKNEREAKTEYRVLTYLQGYSLLEVKPKTGRMHQVRVHLRAIGYPVAGDKLYGKKNAGPEGLHRQFLHASSLSFSYPEGKRWRFEADLPDDLAKVLKNLETKKTTQ
ncbi:RluA family pseudouridine synthase [Patescibacteria group bacterium]|nr:RluA family pseudouridine synthase [Patescibacteria group bacterium]